jgi:uncharacterized protein
MRWSLKELSEYTNQPMIVSEDMNLANEIMERYSKYVISADDDIHVKASVLFDKGDAIVDAHVMGKIIVPSSRSLKPVNLPLDFHIDETYVDTNAKLKQREEEGEIAFLVGEDGFIDFKKSIVDNIILQIPMHILSPDEIANNEMPEGNGWNVMSEEDLIKSEAENKKVDPRLAKLKQFFSDDNNQ